MLGHKTSLNKFKQTEIIQNILSNKISGFKLEISDEKIHGTSLNIWKSNNSFLNNLQAKEGSTNKILKYFGLNDNKSITCLNLYICEVQPKQYLEENV